MTTHPIPGGATDAPPERPMLTDDAIHAVRDVIAATDDIDEVTAVLGALVIDVCFQAEACAIEDDARRLADTGHPTIASAFRFRAGNVRRDAQTARTLFDQLVAAMLARRPLSAVPVAQPGRRMQNEPGA